MSGSATDPDGDPVTYTWRFGGTTVAGSTASTTFGGSGTQNVELTVTDGRGGATTELRSVIIGNMTGQWRLTLNDGCSSSNKTLLLQLTQTGNRVEGTISVPDGFCAVPKGTSGKTDPAEPGSINAAGRLDLRIKLGAYIDSYFRGDMQSPGVRVVGGMFNSGFNGNSATLDKVG